VELPIYVVDAFTSEPFRGNPAGVCPLGAQTLPDELMARIAGEMKHAETAYLRSRDEPDQFDLRWFTPAVEVDLCGHATLASAHLLWEIGAAQGDITFHTRSGALGATRNGDRIALDFPAKMVEPKPLSGPLPGTDKALFTGVNKMDWLVELGSEAEVRSFQPDFEAITRLGMRGLIVTGKGDSGYDFVSRFFAPQCGIPEDPVTGSAHCALAPYWAPKLGKTRMKAFQASERGGEVGVEIVGDRVALFGQAVTVLSGRLCI